MRFNKLDLNLLVALDALLSERSVTRAADKLNLSQSATSNALARLRGHFDDDLLVQVGRKMELTPRADLLLDAVRDVLVRIDATVSAQPQFEPAKSDRAFRILVSDYSMATLMPHALELVYAQSRTIRFDLLPQVADAPRALERGEADLLIIPQQYCSPEHPNETVLQEAFSCVVWNRSRWASDGLTLARYLGAGHVVVRPGGSVQAAVEVWFEQHQGATRRIEVATHSFLACLHLVIGTERIATVHHRLALQAQRWLPVTVLAAPLLIPPMQQALQWHKYRSHDPGLVWLRQQMHAAAAVMDAQAAAAERASRDNP